MRKRAIEEKGGYGNIQFNYTKQDFHGRMKQMWVGINEMLGKQAGEVCIGGVPAVCVCAGELLLR